MGAPPAILAPPSKMDIESSRCKISILFQFLHASSFCLASQATLNPEPWTLGYKKCDSLTKENDMIYIITTIPSEPL
jgi:hypothetical protein